MKQLLTGLIGPVSGLLDKVISDKDAAAKLALEIATMADRYAQEAMLAQVAVNKASAGQLVSVGCTMHSFRHSMRDRLRAVQCPSDIVDQIGGWTKAGVGQCYGSGYPIEVLQE